MTEQKIHKDIVEYLNAVLTSETMLWFTKNETGVGGVKGAITGKRNREMGILPGFPDLSLSPRSKPVPHGLEVKTPKGRQTPAQKAIQADFEARGWPYCIVRSVDDVTQALHDWGVPTRGR